MNIVRKSYLHDGVKPSEVLPQSCLALKWLIFRLRLLSLSLRITAAVETCSSCKIKLKLQANRSHIMYPHLYTVVARKTGEVWLYLLMN